MIRLKKKRLCGGLWSRKMGKKIELNIGILLAIGFLIASYFYYKENVFGLAGVVYIILPIIGQAVSGFIYWICSLFIAYIIFYITN